MFDYFKLDHMSATYGTGFVVGAVTLLQYIPAILGSLASLAAILGMIFQFYWAYKDRKGK